MVWNTIGCDEMGLDVSGWSEKGDNRLGWNIMRRDRME